MVAVNWREVPRQAAAARPAVLIDVLALLAISLLLRFTGLQSNALWRDELFSVYWSGSTPDFILGAGAHLETNPPGQYLLLHYWMQWVGNSVFAVRLPSAIFSAVTVPIVYGIGRRLMDRPTALLAGLLAAIDAAAIHFAQEARPAALAMMCDGIALFALIGAVQRQDRSARRRSLSFALFALASIGAIHAHYTSALFVAASFLAIGVHVITQRPLPWRQVAAWLIAGLGILLGIAPLIRLIVTLPTGANLAWINKPSLHSSIDFAAELMTHPGAVLTAKTGLICLVLVLVMLAGAIRWRPGRAEFGVLVLIPAIFCLLLLGVSFKQPMMLPRVGLWLTIPLCLLLARAAMLTRFRGIVAAIVVIIFVANLVHYRRTVVKEDWLAATDMIATAPQCQGPVIMSYAHGLGIAYYKPELMQRQVLNMVGQWPLNPAETAAADMVLHPEMLEDGQVAAFIAGHPGTAIVMQPSDTRRQSPAVEKLLEAAPLRRYFPGNLSVSCF